MGIGKQSKFKLTQQQGQTLFQIAAGFGLPEKLGETSYNVAERGLAADDVRALYRELRAYSPMYQKAKKLLLFGPVENWIQKEPQQLIEHWVLENPDLRITIRVDDQSHMGAFWCLFLALHPASKFLTDVRSQEDVIWPLAATLRVGNMLRKALGIEEAEKKRLVLDDAPPEKAPEPEKPAEKPEDCPANDAEA